MSDINILYPVNVDQHSSVNGQVIYGSTRTQNKSIDLTFDEAIKSGLYKQAFYVSVMRNHHRIEELELKPGMIIEFLDFIPHGDEMTLDECRAPLDELKEYLELKYPKQFSMNVKVEKAL